MWDRPTPTSWRRLLGNARPSVHKKVPTRELAAKCSPERDESCARARVRLHERNHPAAQRGASPSRSLRPVMRNGENASGDHRSGLLHLTNQSEHCLSVGTKFELVTRFSLGWAKSFSHDLRHRGKMACLRVKLSTPIRHPRSQHKHTITRHKPSHVIRDWQIVSTAYESVSVG